MHVLWLIDKDAMAKADEESGKVAPVAAGDGRKQKGNQTMAISADLVKQLRERSGAGMMDCKKALVEAGGDMEKAMTILREKGISKAATKAGRATKEGVIGCYVHPGDKLAVLVEINCETDFVARTDQYQGIGQKSGHACCRRQSARGETRRTIAGAD